MFPSFPEPTGHYLYFLDPIAPPKPLRSVLIPINRCVASNKLEKNEVNVSTVRGDRPPAESGSSWVEPPSPGSVQSHWMTNKFDTITDITSSPLVTAGLTKTEPGMDEPKERCESSNSPLSVPAHCNAHPVAEGYDEVPGSADNPAHLHEPIEDHQV